MGIVVESSIYFVVKTLSRIADSNYKASNLSCKAKNVLFYLLLVFLLMAMYSKNETFWFNFRDSD